VADLTRAQRLKAIQEAYTAWEQRHERAVKPDPAIVKETHTQYPEGIVAVSATPRMDAELIAMIGEAATYPTDSTVASAFHLPGKHDQRSHGRKGRSGSLPGDWKPVTRLDALDLTVRQMRNVPGNEVTPTQELEDSAAAWMGACHSYRSGNNLVAVNANAALTDEELGKFLGHVDSLSAKYPIDGGVNIYVDTLDRLNPTLMDQILGRPVLAETAGGSGMMHFSDMAASGKLDRPSAYRGDPTQAILAHEWGHAQDTDIGYGPSTGGDPKKQELWANITSNPRTGSEYAATDPDEALAEAFSDHFTTLEGSQANYQWDSTADYAKEYGWGTPPSVMSRES
jgi:hypothetical protein